MGARSLGWYTTGGDASFGGPVFQYCTTLTQTHQRNGLPDVRYLDHRLRTWPTILAKSVASRSVGIFSCDSSVAEAHEICRWDDRWRFWDEDYARSHPRACVSRWNFCI